MNRSCQASEKVNLLLNPVCGGLAVFHCPSRQYSPAKRDGTWWQRHQVRRDQDRIAKALDQKVSKILMLAIGQNARRSCSVSTLRRHPTHRARPVGAERGLYSTLAGSPMSCGGFLGRAQGLLSTSMAIELSSAITSRGVKSALTWQHSRPVPVSCFVEW